MRRLLSALVFFFGLQTVALAQGIPAPSVWQNQRGSTLTIQSIDPMFGVMSGTFINQAPGFQCQNTVYAAGGQVSGPNIVFTVNFIQCNTITVWTGQLNGGVISTNWVLTYPGGTMTGADTFQQIASPVRRKRRAH